MNTKPTYQELENQIAELKKQNDILHLKSIFHKTLDTIDAAIYVADMDTYELLYVNKKGEELIGNKLGQKCYSSIQQGQTKPCEFCTNHLLIDNEGKPKQPYVWEFQNTVTKRWYQASDQAIPWTDGKLVRIEIATAITERKEAENKLEQALQDLKNSETKFEQLSNLTFQGIALHQNGIAIEINPTFTQICGYTPEDVIGKNIVKLIVKKEYHDIVSKNINNNVANPYEVEGIKKDGTEIYIEIEGRNIELENKTIRVAAIRDISERKKFQKELQKQNKELLIAKEKAEASEAKFKQLSNLTFEGIVLHQKGIAIDINLSFAKTFDYTPKEVIGKDLLELIVKKEYHGIVSENIVKSYAFPYEIVGLKKDGSEFPMEIEARDIALDDTTIRVSAVRDISERKNFQKELQKQNEELLKAKEKAELSEDKFRAIIETSPDGIVITALDGTMQYVSPGILAMWAYDDENEMIGRKITDFIRSDYHAKAANSMKDKYDGKFHGATEYVMIKKDGSEFFGESNSSILYNENAEPVSFLIVNRDITNRKNAEFKIIKQKEQLQELNATRDKLFSIIAHDLRSPFNNILGFSELLIENINDFEIEESEKYLTIINSSAKNTLVLLDNLLNWAQSQTGKISFNPVRLIFSNIILEIIKLKKPIAKSKNIALNYFSTDEIYVYADENMLKTILRNLISNAIKFTEIGGQIQVFALTKPEHVEITISDNGIGMNNVKLTELFKLNSNSSTLGTAKEKGSGLGLMLCKDFIEKHNGEIWVESKEGKGSDFKFTLPLEISV